MNEGFATVCTALFCISPLVMFSFGFWLRGVVGQWKVVRRDDSPIEAYAPAKKAQPAKN